MQQKVLATRLQRENPNNHSNFNEILEKQKNSSDVTINMESCYQDHQLSWLKRREKFVEENLFEVLQIPSVS